jgi:hypothetical protein
VNDVSVTVEVSLSGFDRTHADFDELKRRLRQVWVDPEYIYRLVEHDRETRTLVRLEEYPPHVEGETVGEAQLREAREALRGQEGVKDT